MGYRAACSNVPASARAIAGKGLCTRTFVALLRFRHGDVDEIGIPKIDGSLECSKNSYAGSRDVRDEINAVEKQISQCDEFWKRGIDGRSELDLIPFRRQSTGRFARWPCNS